MVAVCTVTGGLLAAGGLPALAAAPVTPTITIAATSQQVITGDVLVVYRARYKYAVATISGAISGAAPGSVVKLYAQRFPYNRSPRIVASASATTAYSFKVKPTIATRYHAELIAPSSDPTPRVKSSLRTVYVTSGGKVVSKRGCVTVPVCHPQQRVYVFLPPAVIKREVSKHWYVYLGVRRSPTSQIPPAPKWLRLRSNATVSRPRRVTATDYERTVGVSFWIGNNSANWTFIACTRDSEAKDGIGLPGQHGCGRVRTVRSNVRYLG
jgi:hypothetical protein